jgi:uncharacterized protein (TIGR02391 family)
VTKWYLEIRKLTRDIAAKSMDALAALEAEDEATARPIKEYLKTDYERLQEVWNEQVEGRLPTSLGRHIAWGMSNDFRDILRRDLPEFEGIVDRKLLEAAEDRGELGFEHLLHPIVAQSSYEMFRNGHLREAVLNSIVAIFDLIRERTGIGADGPNLVNRAFSLTDPYLVLSELESESGQNDQKGFIQVFNGSYQGIRNPKAHTLTHDLTAPKAAQYLVYASLLARRVEESRLVKSEPLAQTTNPSPPTSRSGSRVRTRS